MSTPQPPEANNEDSQPEPQETEEVGNDDLEEGETAPPVKKKRERKEPVIHAREAGKSLFPFSRVQKIVKADKDIPIIARDATFLISLAAEEFIKRLCEAAQMIADREKRMTVQHKDIATVVRKADEFLFLEEIIPWTAAEPPAKRRAKATNVLQGAPTLLDQFVTTSKNTGQSDVVMNEDGTMNVAGTQDDDDDDLE